MDVKRLRWMISRLPDTDAVQGTLTDNVMREICRAIVRGCDHKVRSNEMCVCMKCVRIAHAYGWRLDDCREMTEALMRTTSDNIISKSEDARDLASESFYTLQTIWQSYGGQRTVLRNWFMRHAFEKHVCDSAMWEQRYMDFFTQIELVSHKHMQQCVPFLIAYGRKHAPYGCTSAARLLRRYLPNCRALDVEQRRDIHEMCRRTPGDQDVRKLVALVDDEPEFFFPELLFF
jgi:hypothetical protein